MFEVYLATTVNLADLIAPIATSQGLSLVRVQINGSKAGQTLQVMAEDPATGQLTLEQCETLSRALSEMLDETDPIESEYALEVSSPGIDRPLTRLSDYAKWAGHDVRVKFAESIDGRARLHGAIVGVTGDNVDFSVPTVGPVTVPFAAIESAKLVLTNKLIAASRPLDFGDAEQIVEDPAELADNDNTQDED
nr:ribosome maturation factor [Polymorphobacter sp.]